MPEYLAPGVYVEEIEIGGKPIEGVSTSTAGFIGETERGPAAPHLLTSFGEYRRLYGGYSWQKGKETVSLSYLPYAVEGFFANGGRRCFLGRITGGNSKSASQEFDKFNARAIGPGAWGNRIGVSLRPSNAPGERFKILVFYWRETPPSPIVDPTDRAQLRNEKRREPAVIEEYDELSNHPDAPDFYVKRINGASVLIEVSASGDGLPKLAGDIQLLAGGADAGPLSPQDYVGDEGAGPGQNWGLAAFSEIDEISMVCAPNEHEVEGLSDAIVTHCERMKDRFAILQAKQDAGPVADLRPPVDSKYAAFYYPWIQVIDPLTGSSKLVPPGGHVAGIYARTDTERGVHKAPANEIMRGVADLQFVLTQGEQEVLNPRGVNCLRSFVGRGIRVWGARTTSSDPLWKYVNVRRLFLFLEESIEESTQWVVFEPNNQRLWARVRQTVSDFLTRVWKDGALVGATPEEAFFVRCDETTMTPSEIETGRLIVVVGVAPARPAEFVIFRVAQWRGGSATTE